ncbi:MAG: MFS transporter, partial [Actinomycetes bacterium]
MPSLVTRTASTSARRSRDPVRVLLVADFVINLAFYLVVPFLAVHLHTALGLTGGQVGLVLGLRTFAQQGLFFLGGALADRCAPRLQVAAGCAVRVSGYLLLGFAADLPTAVAGAVLTGLGGALFTPTLEALAGALHADPGPTGRTRRLRLFARLTVAAELGAVLGPVLGALTIGFGFRTVSVLGAAIFAVVAIGLAAALPGFPTAVRATPAAPTPPVPPWTVVRDRSFLVFVLAYSSYLLCYAQLYLALPVELDRVGGSSTQLGLLFGLASLTTLAGQVPLTRLATRIGPAAALGGGFGLMALAFASVGLWAAFPPWPGWLGLLPAATLVVLLVAGQLLAVPTAKSLVPSFARGRPLGA